MANKAKIGTSSGRFTCKDQVSNYRTKKHCHSSVPQILPRNSQEHIRALGNHRKENTGVKVDSKKRVGFASQNTKKRQNYLEGTTSRLQIPDRIPRKSRWVDLFINSAPKYPDPDKVSFIVPLNQSLLSSKISMFAFRNVHKM